MPIATEKERAARPAGPAPAIAIESGCIDAFPSPFRWGREKAQHFANHERCAGLRGSNLAGLGGIPEASELRAPPFMESDRFFPALKVRGLRKTFVRPAVDGLDLTIRAGEFYALLGPNGAGKTTTLRMVVGLLNPKPATSPCSGSMR